MFFQKEKMPVVTSAIVVRAGLQGKKQDGDLPGRGLSERERVVVAGSLRPEVDVGFVARIPRAP